MGRIVFAAIIIGGLLSSVSFGYPGGSGTPEDPYQIADANDLLALAGTTTDYDKCFILTADIDLQGQVFTTAVIAPDTSTEWDFQGTPFTGIFDGNGHVISYLTITASATNYIGLFGYVSGGEIRNLGIENANIEGYYFVGGLVGVNAGTLTACYATGSVSGTGEYVGGLVGGNGGTLTGCYATASVSGWDYVGGLVGYNESGSITSCYATGSVSGNYYVGGLVGYNYYGTLTTCYATGWVTGGYDVGGLVGYNDSGTVTACFWDTETSGTSDGVGNVDPDPAGAMGKNTVDMKTLSTFTSAGWDFDNIWAICEGMNYPKLSWQIPPVGDFTCPDGVDFIDFAIFANAWLSDPTQVNWDLRCDIAEPPDSVIDILDLAIFAQHWLEGL
jgi:hypothetical protein